MIERSRQDGVLTLRLAHGKASALDLELLDALVRELDGLTDEDRAVVLTGTGSIFSAGVDLFRVTNGGAEYVRQFLPRLSLFLRTLFAVPRPVVTAVNGHAIAGGCLMALAADARLMADGPGRIGIPELLVGVPFPMTPLEIVRFALSPDTAQALINTGKTLTCREALAAGLVDEVVAPATLPARAQEVARQLAAIPAAAFRLTKQMLRAPTLERIDQTAGRQDRAVQDVWTAPETLAHIREYLRRTVGK